MITKQVSVIIEIDKSKKIIDYNQITKQVSKNLSLSRLAYL